MKARKALVVYSSWSGNTRQAAERIAAALEADLEPIVPLVGLSGARSFLRCFWAALRRRGLAVRPAQHDPAGYDLVVVGAPVWAGHVFPAVRTWLGDQRGALRGVAFFVTLSGRGHEAALGDMRQASGREPLATLASFDRDRASGEDRAKIEAFVAALQKRREEPAARS